MIVLFSPEHFYLFNTNAVPLLTGYLKENGYPVTQRVLDNEFYAHVTLPEILRKSVAHLKQHLHDLPRDQLEYLKESLVNSNIKNLLVVGRDSPEEILSASLSCDEKLIEVLHNSEQLLATRFLSLSKDRFLLSLTRLQCALDLFTAPFWPARFNIFDGSSFPQNTMSSKAVYKAVTDANSNFFISYYRHKIVPSLSEDSVIAALSLTHGSQIIPAFTLAKEIKSQRPDVHITFGGATVSLLRKSLQADNCLWEFYDSFVVGAGEEPLCRLHDELTASHGDMNRVPNFTWRNIDGKIENSTASATFTIDQVATPVFEDPRPNPIVTLMTSMGCDWAKCRFCHFPRIYSEDSSYRMRPVKDVIRDVEILTRKYAPSYFHICDTNLAVGHLQDISDAVLQSSLTPLFYSFIRAEKQFTDLEFCEKVRKAGFFALHFGLESGSQAVLNRMNKGISLKVTSAILKNFAHADIMANIFLMVGTPTEKEEDIAQTIEFVKEHLPYISGEIAVSRYYLDKYSYIYHHPEEFGVVIDHDPDVDLSTHVNFNNPDGFNPEDMDLLVSNFYNKIGVPPSYGNRFFLEMLNKFCSKDLRE